MSPSTKMSNDFDHASPDSTISYVNRGKEMVEQRIYSISVSKLRKTWEWESRFILPPEHYHPFKLGKVKVKLVKDIIHEDWNLKIVDPGPNCRNPTILLISTQCNYGGTREWFMCPGCSRRVSFLYRDKDNFRCRKCLDLVYYTQKINYRTLWPAIIHRNEAIDMVDKYHSRTRRFYNGKPTKMTIRFEKLRAKSIAGFDYYGSRYLRKDDK